MSEARAEIFGVPLDLLSEDQSVARCVELIEERRPVQHVVINASKVGLMEDVPGLREIVAACDMVNADGQSVVWAGRLLGVRVPGRANGTNMAEALLEECERRGWSVYFLGARPEVLAAMETRMLERYPRLRIAGSHHGYFDDDAAIADMVRLAQPRLLLVGISSPRKEFLLHEQLLRMGDVFAMGVGGSFDVWAGLKRRAPRWAQRCGLEWLYRFLQEPRRMWRRYLLGNLRFILLTLREAFSPGRRTT